MYSDAPAEVYGVFVFQFHWLFARLTWLALTCSFWVTAGSKSALKQAAAHLLNTKQKAFENSCICIRKTGIEFIVVLSVHFLLLIQSGATGGLVPIPAVTGCHRGCTLEARLPITGLTQRHTSIYSHIHTYLEFPVNLREMHMQTPHRLKPTNLPWGTSAPLWRKSEVQQSLSRVTRV